MIKRASINFNMLPDEEFDDPMGESTGAGVIFGATGGVMEAALRTAVETLTGKELEKLEFTEVRGTAQTALYNAGRFIGGASAPVVIPIIAAGHGFGFAIGCVACIYVVAFIAMFFLPEKKGSDLE